MSKFEITLHERQTEAWELLTNEQNLDLLYGGAKGGGKSVLFCLWVFYWANWLIEFFDIKEPMEHPLAVGWIGRLRGVDFSSTTLETWKRTIPSKTYKIKKKPAEIIIRNRVKIAYGGLDNRDTIEKFNSDENAFVALDQAEEVTEKSVSTLLASLRLKFNGKQPPYKSLFTANPRAGFCKQKFIANPDDKSFFVQALPTDNPFVADGYVKDLERRYAHNPALLKAYLEGDWDVFEGAFFETFSRSVVCYNPKEVEIRPEWPKFRSVDWGYSSPMAVYWHAIDPEGHVYTYREWYKTEVLDVDAAKEVNEITQNAGETIEYTIGDPQSFPVKVAHWKFGKADSVQRSEIWAEQGVPMIMGDSSRVNGWAQMLQYMQVRDYMGKPSSWWHISEDCENLIDEIISAKRCDKRVEDISDKSVDHGLESCRLFLMSRKPVSDFAKDFDASKIGNTVLTFEQIQRIHREHQRDNDLLKPEVY